MQEYHYTWTGATYFEPLIGWLHRVGFFSFYVHFPVDSILGTLLFVWVYRRLQHQHAFEGMKRSARWFWTFNYYGISWLTLTSLGVGLKTMIIEELDYQERQWFEPYIAPGHLYIFSVCIVYLAFILRSKRSAFDWVLALYLQVALIVGYIIGVNRILGEDMEGAVGGVFLALFFIACNYDVIKRMRGSAASPPPLQAPLSA